MIYILSIDKKDGSFMLVSIEAKGIMQAMSKAKSYLDDIGYPDLYDVDKISITNTRWIDKALADI